MNCEIKRRARVVQVFPSTESLVRLVGAACCGQNDAWACERSFIDRRSRAARTGRSDSSRRRSTGRGERRRIWGETAAPGTALHHFS